ncbi:hypothetical protein C8R47DRAFT_1064740 [Mycena vitilis]|nr:hypothetical protein C8R47DRAFT_1064740 [Mycena vitilis]
MCLHVLSLLHPGTDWIPSAMIRPWVASGTTPSTAGGNTLSSGGGCTPSDGVRWCRFRGLRWMGLSPDFQSRFRWRNPTGISVALVALEGPICDLEVAALGARLKVEEAIFTTGVMVMSGWSRETLTQHRTSNSSKAPPCAIWSRGKFLYPATQFNEGNSSKFPSTYQNGTRRQTGAK